MPATPSSTNTEPTFEVRHRHPSATDFVIISRVVLVGYPNLSDGAKLTYWVVSSHDWFEQSSGARKGFAYPTVGRLAQLRHATERTIQRHLSELITAGLLTREERAGRPSVLYIEEPSEQETNDYLTSHSRGGDKNGTPPPTKMSPHKKEEEKKDKHVNGFQVEVMEQAKVRGAEPLSVGQILKTRSLASDRGSAEDWLVDQIVATTGDGHSSGAFHIIAKNCKPALIHEALALVKDAAHTTQVHSRGALFISTLRRLCHECGLPDPLAKRESSFTSASEPAESPNFAPSAPSSPIPGPEADRPISAPQQVLQRPMRSWLQSSATQRRPAR